MKTVQILEEDDIIDAEDWCRPLHFCTMSGGMSSDYSFQDRAGRPDNNAKWCKVKYVLPSCRFGSTVESWNQLKMYEFIRGDVPEVHQLDMSEYNKGE